jgi:transcriptional regulator with XRE-family HTH domain
MENGQKRAIPNVKLRELRLKAGMLQEDLETLSGIDQGYISQIENGKAAPSLMTCFKILRAFEKVGVKYTLNDLVEDDGGDY